MTAEIAILNRQAVALAADSAVTINYPGGPKVYNSVNKLFTLSKYQPIGVMIFGAAELTGVPWETIIKTYRESLGKGHFDHLEGYAADFIRYINQHRTLFSAEQQRRQFLSSIILQYRAILRDFEAAFHSQVAAQGPLSTTQVSRLLTRTITEHRRRWVQRSALPGAPPNLPNRLRRRWPKEIDGAIQFVFGASPLSGVAQPRLRDIAGRVFTADLFPDNVSGIVIAGFGAQDFFPRVVSFDVEGVLLNFMKIRKNTSKSHTIDGTSGASIIPFAQSEMVALFMEGLDPYLKLEIARGLESFVDALTNVVDGTTLSTRAKDSVKTALGSTTGSEAFFRHLEFQIRTRHIQPVVESVSHLPKEELASMAESLVSLTSFKRRVSLDPETVGGPIDVAVISKGDGFIWIKRKHYFDGGMNHQFFANYFR